MSRPFESLAGLRYSCGRCDPCTTWKHKAADRIETLEAERDTLAEIVRRLLGGWHLIRDLSGDVWGHHDPGIGEQPVTEAESRALARIRNDKGDH